MTKWLIGIFAALFLGLYMLFIPATVRSITPRISAGIDATENAGILLRQLFISEDAKHCFNGMVRGESLMMKETECLFK